MSLSSADGIESSSSHHLKKDWAVREEKKKKKTVKMTMRKNMAEIVMNTKLMMMVKMVKMVMTRTASLTVSEDMGKMNMTEQLRK